MAITRRGARAHRASATTRSQLLVAAVVAALVAVLLGTAVAQAAGDDGTGAAEPSSPLLLTPPFAQGTVTTTKGTETTSPAPGRLAVGEVQPGGSYTAALATAPVADVDVTHSLVLHHVDASNPGLYEQTQARVQPDGDRYGLTVLVRHSGHVALRVDRVSGGEYTVLSRTGKVAVLAEDAPLLVQVRVVGSSPVVLQARVWRMGAERPDWQVTVRDEDPERLQAPGAVALQGYLSRKAEPLRLTLADVSVAGFGQEGAAAGGGAVAEPVTAPNGSSGGAPATGPTTTSPDPATTPSTDPSAGPSAEPSTAPSSSPPPVDPSTEPTSEPASSPSPSASASTGGGRTSPAGFVHPGIMTSASQLAAVRAKVAAGEEPWASAFAKAKGSSWANLSWQPQPVPVVMCGAYNRIDIGCTAETKDAQAAYTMALIYTYTGDERYARKAVEILDAWSGVLQSHSFDTTTYVNGRLQAAWAGSVFPKAAELIRYSDAGWSPDRVQRFEGMLRTAFLPMVRDGWVGGNANWQMSMAEATVNIGIFLDDRSVFDDGVGDWRAQVVSSIYLTSDGAKPVLPAGTSITAGRVDSYWFSPERYVDGLQGETCRDADHMMMGMAAALDVAETAGIQGVDLYREQQRRLVAGLEYNARYLNDPSAPGWVCPAPLKKIGTASNQGWEVGYAHYAGEGVSLPQTQQLVRSLRPRNGTELFMNWSTLTHARS